MTAAPLARRTPVAFLLVVVLALVALVVPAGQAPAGAATFRAGMIISDAVFYNSSAMTTNQIQSFLEQKAPSCVPSPAGIPCLKDFRQTTATRSADARCTGSYQGAANESAAAIIKKVSDACGINPQVLLVLLQKEQSLVTASGSGLTARRYQIATGYGCPDTAPCDEQFYGFYNQVYKAAWQFRSYALNPYNFAHVPGRSSQTIAYHPSAACGRTNVYIENQATASLYNYTPYTPNAALLAGQPDGCSSYGNYNFANYFTQWFGSPSYPVIGAIGNVWNANKDVLGQPVGPESPGLVFGGVVQSFEGGHIYWSPASGAHVVRGGIASYWAGQGWERGILGYPTASQVALVRQGAVQSFQGGDVYWSPVGGGQRIYGAMHSRWASLEAERGLLGYPVTSESALRDRGAVQSFESGTIYYSPAYGAFAVRGGIYQLWASRGWENGLGYPVVGEFNGLREGGAVQSFEQGAIYWTPMYGPKVVRGAVLTWWGLNGWENGRLGYPTSNETTSGQLVQQTFERGRITFDTRNGAVTVQYS